MDRLIEVDYNMQVRIPGTYTAETKTIDGVTYTEHRAMWTKGYNFDNALFYRADGNEIQNGDIIKLETGRILVKTSKGMEGGTTGVFPVAGKTIDNYTSAHGYRRDPKTDYTTVASHNGLDVGATNGTTLYAMYPGVVVMPPYTVDNGDNCFNGSYGYTVAVESEFHGEKIQYFYAHMLSKKTVAIGAQVKAGDELGKVGDSGSGSRGEHLHLELRINDQVVNSEPGFVVKINQRGSENTSEWKDNREDYYSYIPKNYK